MKKRILSAAGVCLLFLTIQTFADTRGWADENGGTTGGAGGPTVTVSDEPNFIKYASYLTPGPYIVQVSGTINIPTTEDAAGHLEVSSNKTIRGIGTNPTIIGNFGFKNRDGNIIVENLNITNPHKGSAYDGMSVKDTISHVVITKCTFYDTGDGACDISGESDYVTVSWCKFYYTSSAPDPGHTFACLVGSSDKQTEDSDNLRVTYHHNWWSTGCKERMPRVRYGQVHVYNNYYSNLVAGGYCVGVGCGSRIRVESNYFNAVPAAWKDYYTGTGYAAGTIGWNTGNIYYNCSQPTWATNAYSTIFTPPYEYTLDDTNDIPSIVQAYAGAGTPYPPHWYSTVYGDFDKDGTVEIDDLAEFADYWLGAVCADLSDADYDTDCNVNFYEFSLMGENWMK
jgi:pectate lyase